MSNRSKLFLPIVFFFAMTGLLLYGLREGRDPNILPSALLDRALPEFSEPDLFDENGRVTSDQLKGGIFVVNVWATWCPTCVAEHAYFVEKSESETELTFVGVNYKDDVEEARAFLEERGNPFELNVADIDGSFGIDLGVTSAPETFLVDASGTVRYRHVGMVDSKVWSETFEPLIAQMQ
jgi:cytochrome c biogenesis protein CcmG, thiol:disulfide interchange protein DsbE